MERTPYLPQDQRSPTKATHSINRIGLFQLGLKWNDWKEIPWRSQGGICKGLTKRVKM